MSDIRQITDWRAPTTLGAVYERLPRAIGTDAFGPTVRDSVMSMTAGARRIYLFEATGREDAWLQYFHGEPGLVELFPAYRKWYLRQDPVCDAYRAAPECTSVVPAADPAAGYRLAPAFDGASSTMRASWSASPSFSGARRPGVRSISRGMHRTVASRTRKLKLIDGPCMPRSLPMLPLNRKRASDGASRSPLTQLEERFAQ